MCGLVARPAAAPTPMTRKAKLSKTIDRPLAGLRPCLRMKPASLRGPRLKPLSSLLGTHRGVDGCTDVSIQSRPLQFHSVSSHIPPRLPQTTQTQGEGSTALAACSSAWTSPPRLGLLRRRPAATQPAREPFDPTEILAWVWTNPTQPQAATPTSRRRVGLMKGGLRTGGEFEGVVWGGTPVMGRARRGRARRAAAFTWKLRWRAGGVGRRHRRIGRGDGLAWTS